MANAYILFLLLTAWASPAGAVALDRAHEPVVTTQAAVSSPARVASRITVIVPNEDAEVFVGGVAIHGSGESREFETPRLDAGTTHLFTITATWRPNTYTEMTRTRVVSVRAGEPLVLDLTVSDPNDRVRVMYVPTPADIAEAMVDLAGVTSADVVFEPGCGDARITIAAVQAGAWRGVGVDIDPDRVEDSRANVREAGLTDRIEIRQGDALDIRDLSSATVVLLYMGDHFNLLMRPILWRELPVGARVVSHRFRMGDWEPDRTVMVTSEEGGEYELHLWTITEDVKQRRGAR